MSCTSVNEYGQTVGFAVSDFLKGRRSSVLCLEGRHCTVDHLSKKHEESLYQHLIQEGCVSDWTCLPYEMPEGKAEFQNFLSQRSNDPDAYFFAVLDRQRRLWEYFH